MINTNGSADLIVNSDSLMTSSGTYFVLKESYAKYHTDIDMNKLEVKAKSPTVVLVTNESINNSPTVAPTSLDLGIFLLNDNFENDQNNWYVLDAKTAIVEDCFIAMKIFKQQHQCRGGIW